MNFEDKPLRYNWYETNLVKFLTKYSLPMEYNNDFLKILRKIRRDFLSDFKSILIGGEIKAYSDDVYIKFSNAYSFIDKLFRNLISIVSNWEAGKISESEVLIESIFCNLERDFYITNIDQGWFNHEFFRVRVASEKESFKNRPLELFHIPYPKRYLARNDRYNMAGKINLYLSTCLNLACANYPWGFLFSPRIILLLLRYIYRAYQFIDNLYFLHSLPIYPFRLADVYLIYKAIQNFGR